MPNISLKWRIFWFYCALGLLPQATISYFSVDAYTQSLEHLNNRHISQLVAQAAEQTDTRLRYLIKDLTSLVTQPYLQLSFQQYPQPQRLLLIKERLELFRGSTVVYSRLSLCSRNGERVVSTPGNDLQSDSADFERDAIARTAGSTRFHRIFGAGHGQQLAFFIPVSSFRQSTRIVGFLVGYIPFGEVTVFLERLDLGQHAQKSVMTADGRTVQVFFAKEEAEPVPAMRTYAAPLKVLGWEVMARIAEDELLADVRGLKRKTMFFIAAIIVLALVTSIIFSHHLTRPFKRIIAGTRAFARGDLTHRITVGAGHEGRQLAEAFNEMAGQLNARQMELNRAARLASLGVMTAGIAHEIKNPLTGIKTSSQVIHRLLDAEGRPLEGADSAVPLEWSEIRELSTTITEEVDRLTKILNDLLSFGRPRPARLTASDLAGVARQAAGLVRAEFEKKQVRLKTRVFALKVTVDPDQLLQVLLNLLFNALEAVSSGTGRVDVVTGCDPDGTPMLSIIDNGVGIPESKLQHIFDPFFSLRENGIGLGLSVVYTLLKQNHAHLAVKSRVGQGTTFDITFYGTLNQGQGGPDDGNSHC